MSLSLDLCPAPSGAETSVPALSVLSYSQSLAAWSNTQLVFTQVEGLHWGVIRELHAPKQLRHECTPIARRAPKVPSVLWSRQRLGLNLRFSSRCKSRNMAEAPLPPFHQFCEWHLLFYKYEPDTGLRNCWKLNRQFSSEINFSQWVKWKVFSLSDILTICSFPTQCAELNWRAGSIWMPFICFLTTWVSLLSFYCMPVVVWFLLKEVFARPKSCFFHYTLEWI